MNTANNGNLFNDRPKEHSIIYISHATAEIPVTTLWYPRYAGVLLEAFILLVRETYTGAPTSHCRF